MSFIGKILGRDRKVIKAKMIEATTSFSAYNGDAYSNDVFREAVDSIARNAGKLKGSHVVRYPDHKQGDEIPNEVRILTIIDVYDALTAEDRPYKPPMPVEKAFGILDSMRDHGEIDGKILEMFKESRAWEKKSE